MKNFKKISVVLFATLLSFNFTSCIDDGVSDAVDQVYLAQATFLQAQAALKDAEAQVQIAKAATEAANARFRDAEAEVELAYARETDAYTAQVQANTANTLAAAAHLAQLNANALIKATAQLEIDLVGLQEALATAQSKLEVTMLNLAQKIADTENDIIRRLYGTYSAKMFVADGLENTRITKLQTIAKNNLALVVGDLTSLEYARVNLINALDAALTKKGDAEGRIIELNAMTPSDPQQQITDLKAEKDVLGAKQDSLGVVLADRENDVDIAKVAWANANADNGAIIAKQGEITVVENVIAAHNVVVTNANEAITKANDNIAAIPAAEIALAAIDTTAAFNGIAIAEQAIDDAKALLGRVYPDPATATLPANLAPTLTDSPRASTTAWDVEWNADLAKQIAAQAVLDGQAALTFGGIPALEIAYQNAVVAAAVVPGTTTATLLANLNAADAAENAAQLAFDTDPAGSQNAPGPDGILGNHADAANIHSYAWVQTAVANPAPNGLQTVDMDSTLPLIAPLVGVVLPYDQILDGPTSTGPDVAVVFDYYDVEADDSSISNLADLNNKRTAADIAQQAYDFRILTEAGLATAVTNTKAALYAAYIAASGGTTALISIGDFQGANDHVNNVLAGRSGSTAATIAEILVQHGVVVAAPSAGDAMIAAYEIVAEGTVVGPGTTVRPAEMGLSASDVLLIDQISRLDALAGVADAIAALGVVFSPDPMGVTYNNFLSHYDNWLVASGANTNVAAYTIFGVYAGVFERFQGIVNAAGDIDDINDLPHVATSSYTPTAYDVLRNAYFMLKWAQDDLAALQTVAYASPYGESNETGGVSYPTLVDPNATTIEEANKDIAKITDLLVADQAALDALNAQMAELIAEFGLDTLLFNHHTFTYTVDAAPHVDGSGAPATGPAATTPNLGYIPLLADYLNAVIARNKVRVAITACNDEIKYVTNVINHLKYFLIPTSGSTTATAEDVAAFNAAIDALIVIEEGKIATAIVTIEKTEVLIELHDLTVDKIADATAELEREIVIIDNQLNILYTSAANILARINVLLN
jgi:hypothetical protein